jgi:glyoxylase-like metal-dependent hydrolase (beta-lactamase superfamily II)
LIAGAALAFGALFETAALAQQQGQPPQFVKINDAMYVYSTGQFSGGHATALVTDEGVLLVDSKGGNNYDGLVAALRGVTDKPVKYVVNTHYHGDHAGGNARFQADGATIVASEKTSEIMRELKLSGQPSVTVQDTGRIRLGGKTVELLYLGRGHTSGDLFVYFPDYRVLVTGDMFTSNGDQLLDYAAGGSIREWTKTLDRVLMIDFDKVVPGHGVTTTDRAAVRGYRDAMVALRQRIEKMLADKAPKAEIEKLLRTEYHWQDFHVARGLDGLLVELQYR